MDRRLSDEQLDRALMRILAEQGAEIEAWGITPARAAARVRVQRPAFRTRFQTMNTTLKIAAVAVLALAVGIGFVQRWASTDQIGSAPAPSPSPSPLVWTPASIEQDWPAPVREEPVGDPVIIQVPDGYLDPQGDLAGGYLEPQGDIESPDMPWIDILRVQTNGRQVLLDLGGALPSEFVVPSDPWIAYGLVFDTDLDGVADVRLGMDKIPAEYAPWGGTGDTDTRVWRTDLRTGVTAYGENDTQCDCSYPEPADPDRFVEVLGSSVTPPPETVPYRPEAKLYPWRYPTGDRFEIPGPFYVWASVIQDGRVVATDYAPDTGWLDNAVKPEPSGSSAP